MIDRNLLQTLTDIGMEDKEARAYLATLELGKAPASAIAEKAGVKRSIVYYTIEKLKTAGFVQEHKDQKIKTFSAADPSKVFKKADSAVEELRFMLPLIRALQEKGGEKPRTEYLEGREAIDSLFRLYDRGKSQRFLTSIERLMETIPGDAEAWVHRYETGRIKSKGRFLLTHSPQDRAWGERISKTGQEVRLMNEGAKMDMDFAVVDGMLGITSMEPLFAVVIHSERVAHSAASLFDMAWMAAKSV